MIVELFVIVGLSIAFSMALSIVYFFRYFQRYFKDPEEFKRSNSLFLYILIALILHSLYSLGGFLNIEARFYLEILSVLIFLGTMLIATRRALMFEISSEVRKEEKVRQLMRLRTLQDELGNTTKELAELKNFLDNILQSSADAIVAADTKKRITYFSKGAEDLFERSAKDVMGTNVLSLYPKSVLGKNERIKRARTLKEQGHIRNMSMKIITPKGGKKHISLTLSLLRDPSGAAMGTVGVARDITEEVKAADEIRYLKELSEKVIEGSPEGVVLIGLDFTIHMVNHGFEEIAEVKKESIVGKNALEYLKNPNIEKLFEALDFKQKFVKVAYEGLTLTTDEIQITLNNRSKTLTDYWTPLLSRKGSVEYVLLIVHDISKRKALEEDLKKQALELKRSNELKDMFTDIMRHDLLNPIGVIKNYVELMILEPLDEGTSKSVEGIMRNATKAVEMIETASSLSKIESESEIKFLIADLGELLGETINNVQSRADKKNIKIESQLSGEYPGMVASFIEEVFLNFLTNAIKYSPSGTTVTCGIEDGKKSWKVYVKDQGEGIPDEFKETIFTRFERVKREGVRGTGLGLAIVKRIAELHKGRVWVEDNPEGGSIFYLEIPKSLN